MASNAIRERLHVRVAKANREGLVLVEGHLLNNREYIFRRKQRLERVVFNWHIQLTSGIADWVQSYICNSKVFNLIQRANHGSLHSCTTGDTLVNM